MNMHAKVLAKVRAKSWAETKCVAVVKGTLVVGLADDFHTGNLQMCAMLDDLEAKNGHCADHGLDLKPLSYLPKVGDHYDQRCVVFHP